ncbi:hypothetical protein [Streptomyces sp. 067-1]
MGTCSAAGRLALVNGQRPVQPEGTARPAGTSGTADDTEEIR